MMALLLADAAAAAAANDPRPVHYTCADGTELRAMFSPFSVAGISEAGLSWILDGVHAPASRVSGWRPLHSWRRGVLDQG